MAVLYPAATVVNDIEGTQYVTASLVLPSVYMLIHKVRKGEIVCNWDDSVVQPQQTKPEVRAARANLRTALEENNLSRKARQYLATPATSAGVESLLSAAALTFGDLVVVQILIIIIRMIMHQVQVCDGGCTRCFMLQPSSM